MNTCFFIGHREAPPSLLPRLQASVAEKIESQHILHFVVCHYGMFDTLAAQAVLDAKKRRPEVTLTLLLPYPMSCIPAGFDGTFTPPGIETVSRRFAIVYANRYMIAHSDCLIAYVTHTGSNAARFLAMARERAGVLRVENIGSSFSFDGSHYRIS